MSSANETFRRAATSNAKLGADTAKTVRDEVSEFASDVSRQAGKQFDRAKDMAVDAYEEAYAAGKQYPYTTLAIAAGLGFLIGMIAVSRR